MPQAHGFKSCSLPSGWSFRCAAVLDPPSSLHLSKEPQGLGADTIAVPNMCLGEHRVFIP